MICISYFDLFIQSCTFPLLSCLVLVAPGAACGLHSGENLLERFLVRRKHWLGLLWFWQELISRKTENLQSRQVEHKVWNFRQEIIVKQDHLNLGVPAQWGGDEDEEIVPDKQCILFGYNVNWWKSLALFYLGYFPKSKTLWQSHSIRHTYLRSNHFKFGINRKRSSGKYFNCKSSMNRLSIWFPFSFISSNQYFIF